MKKLLFIFCILMLTAAVFAQPNNQKIWDVDSQIYKDMVSLYLLEGYALPSSVGPWSTDELNGMLAVFDGKTETEAGAKLYAKIAAELSKEAKVQLSDGFAADYETSVIPQVYFHTNDTDFTQESDWNYDYIKREPLLNFNYELFPTKNIYLRSGFNVGLDDGSTNSAKPNSLYQPKFNTSIPFVGSSTLGNINFNFPETAFTSVGGEHWNVLFGREVIRWGNGETGNLYYGGNQPYSNAIRFTTYFQKFKYTFVTDFSSHEKSTTTVNSQNDTESGIRFFMTHRFDFKLLKEKLNFSVAEGFLYQSADNTFDIRVFNPMMFYHNLYIRANANSILGFDADYAVCKGLNLYGQFVVDEFPLVGEPTTASENGGRPDKMGGMLGIKYAMPLADGILRFNLEGVYADPYLYLREQYDSSTGKYGVSFYSYLREFHQYDPTVLFLKKCIGYKYGGDCITGDFKVNYTTFENWISELDLFYMAHGVIYNDFVGDDWAIGKSSAPSTHDIAEPGKTPSKNPDGFVEHTVRVSLNTSYPVNDWLSVGCGIDNFFITNKGNVKAPMTYDMQLNALVKIHF